MKRIQRITLLLIIIISCLGITGCQNNKEDVDIYASIYPIYFLTDRIVQDKVKVKQVYPMGTDVHDYDPGFGSALVSMAEAKLMFYIGYGLESFIDAAKDTVFSKSDLHLVELGSYIQLIDPITINPTANEHKHDVDTHVWMDPVRMIQFAQVIYQEIIKIYPDDKDFFLENTRSLIDDLQKLDDEYVEFLSDPDLQKVMLVDHDAYVYWEDRYGIQRIRTRVDNESCDVVPSDWGKNIEKAKEYNIKYIVITKNESSCTIINNYAKELNAEIVELNHVATLTKSESKNGENYISIMEKNLEVLKKILPKK